MQAAEVEAEHLIPRRRGTRKLLAAVCVCTALLLALAETWHYAAVIRAERRDVAILSLLHSDEPEQRKRGAWLSAEHSCDAGWAYVRAELPRESNPDVREAYVYTLGRMERAEDFDRVVAVVGMDDSGYVRQAAWLAAARIDAACFAELVAACPTPSDPWDQIGVAQGWLWNADVRGIDELLHGAVQGDADQRLVASRALLKGLWPILEAVGRWPVGVAVREGEAWTPELVAEVARRCAGLDLQRIVDDSRPHMESAKQVRRNVGRLAHARERIRRFLFAS